MSSVNIAIAYAEKPDGIAECKMVSWPFYYWVGLIDASEIDEMDPLQELILNLIASNKYKKSELSRILGISKEVLSAVEEKCITQGYLDPKKRLTKDCAKRINATNYYEKDLEGADKAKKVIVFQDAISGDIVPFFDLERINNLYHSDKEAFVLNSKTEASRRPTFIDLGIGIKSLNRLDKLYTQYEQVYGNQVEDIKQEDIIESLIQIELDEDDEVFWEDEIKESIIEMPSENRNNQYDERIEPQKNSKFNPLKDESSRLIIKSTEPQSINLAAYIYIHPDNIDEYFVRSPFGRKTDAWFLNKMRKEYSRNDELKMEIDLLRESLIEKYKDLYTFNNINNIDLLDKLPKLANYEKYVSVKKELVGVHNAYNRIFEGHEDYDTYFTRVQRTLECLLNLLVKDMYDWQQLCQNVYYPEYYNQIEQISNKLGIDVPNKLKSKSMCKNINDLRHPNSGAIKDRSMMFLLEAYYNKEKAFLSLCKQIPDFFEKIILIADTRNKHAHYSELDLTREHYLDRVRQINDAFQEIILALFNYYVEEKNYGKEKE